MFNSRSLSLLYSLFFLLFVFPTSAHAAPLVPTATADFVPTSAVEEPGTYPPKISVYGAYSADSVNFSYARLTSSDGFATTGTMNLITGPAYVTLVAYSAFAVCPLGLSCGGYKAFYAHAAGGYHIFRCTGFDGSAVSGCSEVTHDLTSFGSQIGLTTDGDTLLLSGVKVGDTKAQVFSSNITAPVPSFNKLTACGDTSFGTGLAGVAGKYLFVKYGSPFKSYRLPWNGTTCTGSRQLLSSVLGWDTNVANNANQYTIGPISGKFFGVPGGIFFETAAKDWSPISDSFISSAEKCDNNAIFPLNNQTCTSAATGGPSGFTGGTLACKADGTWNTAGCTSSAPVCGDGTCNGAETFATCPADCPAVCGNSTKEAAEECDGDATVPAGTTCAALKGAGWTGSVTKCTGACKFDTSMCALAPTCGDGTCNGAETFATCPGDCPAVCGNSTKEGAEECDGDATVPAGLTCAALKGAGWTGSVTKCTAGCKYDATLCSPPPTCGDGIKNGTEECDITAVPAVPAGMTCATKMTGYTGSLSCSPTCTLSTSACVPPATCGNGTRDGTEVCEGLDLGGKTCTDIKPGYGGTLKCSTSCTFDTASCTPPVCPVNIKSGSCTVDCADVTKPKLNVSPGTCQIGYTSKGSPKEALITLSSTTTKVLEIPVANFPNPAYVELPPGVSVKTTDNGNKVGLGLGTGSNLGVEGTIYEATWITSEIVRFECTEGKIRLSKGGTPVAAIAIPGELNGMIPNNWGVEYNVFTGTVTKAPYKLIPDVPDGGLPDGGDAGSGGSDGGTGGDSGAAGDGGSKPLPDGGAGSDAGSSGGPDAGTATPATPGDPENGGGCACSTGSKPGAQLSILLLSCLIYLARRKRGE